MPLLYHEFHEAGICKKKQTTVMILRTMEQNLGTQTTYPRERYQCLHWLPTDSDRESSLEDLNESSALMYGSQAIPGQFAFLGGWPIAWSNNAGARHFEGPQGLAQKTATNDCKDYRCSVRAFRTRSWLWHIFKDPTTSSCNGVNLQPQTDGSTAFTWPSQWLWLIMSFLDRSRPCS